VFKKEEVEREPITISLFPEYFEDSETEESNAEVEANKGAKKYQERMLDRMGGHYDPLKIGQDDYMYIDPRKFPAEILKLITLSYKRYLKYIHDPEFIKNEEISRFKRDWITNAVKRIPKAVLDKEDELIRNIFQEIFGDYRIAIKKSIMNYILLSPEERLRLSIPLLLRDSPCSSERITKAGSFSVLIYKGWHSFVENAKEFLQNNLYNMNIVNSSILNWNEDFKEVSLVENDIIQHMAVLGKSMSPHTFMKIQRHHREKTQAFYKNVWLKGVFLIMKKFRYIRIHKEKKGHWSILGFSKEKLDVKGFLKKSIENVSVKMSEENEDIPETIYNVIQSRVNEVMMDYLDVPISAWGSIKFEDLLDIRDNPSYQYYSLFNKEPVLLQENGYKLLNKEVRARLRKSVGVLMSIKLREKIDLSLKMFSDLVLKAQRYQDFKEIKGQQSESRFAGEESRLDSLHPNVVEIDTKRSDPKSKELSEKDKSGLSWKSRCTKTLGKNFDFLELKQAVEPFDCFFLEIEMVAPEFLHHQNEFRPFLQLELIVENEIIKFSDSEEVIRALFSKMHSDIIDTFKYFQHPEYVSVGISSDPLEEHPAENYPTDKNYESFFKRFLPNITMKEKKRKRKIQSILETTQIDDFDEKSKYLTVTDVSERHYIESCEAIISHVINHYNDSKVASSLFDQFKPFFDKSVEKYVKLFLAKPVIALEELRKCLVMVRSFKTLLDNVPDDVFFPLFQVRTYHVKEYLRKGILDLDKQVTDKMKESLNQEMMVVKSEFDLLTATMKKPIANANEYQEMEAFMTHLMQEKVSARSRGKDIFRRLLYCINLEISEFELFSKAKDLFESPEILEKNIQKANDRHAGFKQEISERLEAQKSMFKSMIDKLVVDLNQLQGMTSFNQYRTNMEKMNSFNSKIIDLEEMMKDINDQELKLYSKYTEFKILLDIRGSVTPILELWSGISTFMSAKKGMLGRRVFEVSIGEIDDVLREGQIALKKMKKVFSNRKDEAKILDEFDVEVQDLKNNYNKLEILSNKGLSSRHWDEIKQIINYPSFNFQTDTMADLLDEADIVRHLLAISEISKQASTEYKLSQMLAKIETEWSAKCFEVINYKNSETRIFAGASFEELQMLLDDNVLKTQTIKSDPAVMFMLDRATEWENRLVFLQEACELWVDVQQNFLYLLPVFNSEDIKGHMKEEAARFKKICVQWEDWMKAVSDDPVAIHIQNIPDLLQSLQTNLANMEAILKSLEKYLDDKRGKFPRFYFLSNEEMLSILSETKDPQLVQPHLKKCFEGINELNFTLENEITGMKSELGELIAFENKIVPKAYKAAVEDWLLKVEEEMRHTLKARIEDCLVDLAKHKGSRAQWIESWPGQCILVCSQISWVYLVEDKLKQVKLMKELKDELNSLLLEVVNLIRGERTETERMTLSTLITLEVHNLDIVGELIAQRCNSPTDFDWASQLRYYLSPTGDKNVSVQMVVTKINYGFEYLGNTTRLVITPLTDRCYRTLMSALFLNLGGPPRGRPGQARPRPPRIWLRRWPSNAWCTTALPP
jgi:dynein heavy chain